MKIARLSAHTAATKAAATLKCQAWARRLASLVLLAGTLILCAVPKTTLGNLFVVDQFNNGRIGEYTNSGATVNASLITGLGFPRSIAVSGGFLYVTDPVAGTVGKYTTSGATIDASLISGLNGLTDIEISGGDLYVAEKGDSLTGLGGQVGKYTTSGATVNASLITFGLMSPAALAISGTNLFVGSDSSEGSGIGEYTTSGTTVNASLITGFHEGGIVDVEASGSSLFVSRNYGDGGLVGKYNLDGTPVNAHLIEEGYGGSSLAISGTDLFFVGYFGLSKATTSGMIIADPLVEGSIGFGGGIAVEDQATVPETLSTLWFALVTVGLLGFATLLQKKCCLHLSR